MEGTQSQGVTGDSANACTNACTGKPESEHATAAEGSAGPTTGATLAAALAMIADLPLTPAEKAEAVRRLLAGA